jgi:HEAT repeat protein
MMHFIAFAAIFAAATSSPSAEQVMNVRARLSAIEQSPNYDALRTSPYARAAFEMIARDATVPMAIRARALEGIASYRDDAAFARVTAAIDDASLPIVVRRDTLLGFGIQFQGRALPIVERILANSEDVQFRRVAAMTLKRIHTPESLALAKQAIVSEPNEVVRNDLRFAVEDIGARPPVLRKVK